VTCLDKYDNKWHRRCFNTKSLREFWLVRAVFLFESIDYNGVNVELTREHQEVRKNFRDRTHVIQWSLLRAGKAGWVCVRVGGSVDVVWVCRYECGYHNHIPHLGSQPRTPTDPHHHTSKPVLHFVFRDLDSNSSVSCRQKFQLEWMFSSKDIRSSTSEDIFLKDPEKSSVLVNLLSAKEDIHSGWNFCLIDSDLNRFAM
jgi:hypothetical protein